MPIHAPRADAHRPAVLNPADYRFETAFYQGDSDEVHVLFSRDNAAWDALRAERPLFQGNYAARHTCDHCGARFAYGACYTHLPTGDLIHVGHQCAGGILDLPDRVALLRRQAERAQAAAAERRRIAAQADAWRADNPAVAAHLDEFASRNPFYRDLLAKLARYGALTERQTAAVAGKIDADRARRDADAALPAATPVVYGPAVTITGEVLSVRWQDNPFSRYGGVQKMRVRDDRNFVVWGTVPAALGEVERGDRVRFVATVEPSADDPTFGFFKRPRQAARLDAAPAACLSA